MIVRDEERFLEDALRSVAGLADELCIVDTGSTDATVAIAQRYGARIAHVAWTDDFSAARNAALALATRSWILVLDADERLAEDSRSELAAIIAEPPDGLGRWLRARNLTDDVVGTGAASSAIVRLFPNDPAIRYRGRIHEFVGRVGDPMGLPARPTGINFIHHGYLSDVITARAKGERNARLAHAAAADTPDDPAAVYNLAMALLLARDLEGAEQGLIRTIALTEGQPRGFRPQALVVYAGLLLDRGNWSEARRIARQTLAIVPTLPDAHFLLAKTFVAEGNLAEARSAFMAAIEAGATAAEHFVVDDEIAIWKAQNEIAATFMREENYAEALPWIARARAARPAAQPLVFNDARAHEMIGDLATALSIYRAASETYRDETAATEYVNFVLRHGGPDVCIAAIESVQSMVGPDSQRALLTTGAAVMLRVDRLAEADALLERVLAIGDPVAGMAVIHALAEHFSLPALAGRVAPAIGVPR